MLPIFFIIISANLASTVFYASFAHKMDDVSEYLKAVSEAFAIIAEAVSTRAPEKYLKGPVCHSGFARLN